MVFKTRGEIPEMVKTVMGIIEETERFQDYRVVGNKYGTTIVLRYTCSGHDMPYGHIRQSPEWKHRSAVNVTRDSLRYNEWCKQGTNPLPVWSNLDNREPSIVEHSTPTDPLPREGTSFFQDTQLNPNAKQFCMPVAQHELLSTSISTQTEAQVEMASVEIQTETLGVAKTCDIGIQCKPSTQAVGINCRKVISTKSRFIQATPTSVSKGVSATSCTTETGSQPEYGAFGPTKQDAAVMCAQSPGAISRHMQTHKTLVKDFKTNTVSPTMAHAATDMDGFKIKREECVKRDHTALYEEEDLKDTPSRTFQGQSGFTDILDCLGVRISDIRHYAHRIQNRHRNLQVRGVVKASYKYKRLDKVEEGETYYAVMDDFFVDMYMDEKDKFEVGRYTKLYGDWQHMLSDTGRDVVTYTILNSRDEVVHRCETVLMKELDRILTNIRSRHTDTGGYGGYGGCGSYGRNSSFGNYGNGGEYGGYSDYDHY